MNKEKRCLINYFSKGREHYYQGTERLVSTALTVGASMDMIIWGLEFDLNKTYNVNDNIIYQISGKPNTKKFGECPDHKDFPYIFKCFAFQSALELGYTSILWCDSSIMILKNPQKYFELAEEIGVILFNNEGLSEAEYTSDDCLEHMGCSVEEARMFDQCDASTMIFNFDHFKTKKIFDEYYEHCIDGVCLNGKSGSSRPEFKAHRHDQSIISFVARKNGIANISYGGWIHGGSPEYFDRRYTPTFAKIGVDHKLELFKDLFQR